MTRAMPARSFRRAHSPQRLLLLCPRISPQWELSTLRTLMKPKGERLHVPSQQCWPAGADDVVRDALDRLSERLGVSPSVTLHAEGEYHLVVELSGGGVHEARAAGLVLSSRLPGVWFSLDRLLIRNGRFVRRAVGYRIELVQATSVRLPREIRAQVRDLLHPTPPRADDPPRPRAAQQRRAAFFNAYPGRRNALRRHQHQRTTRSNCAASSADH